LLEQKLKHLEKLGTQWKKKPTGTKNEKKNAKLHGLESY